MSVSFSDRGAREYGYRVIPTGTKLQQMIQLAGYVSECVKLEAAIQKQDKPVEAMRNDTYNALTHRLNRYADNPSVAGLGAWSKLKKDVLSYFDSRLPIYADPTSPLTSPGFILDTRKRTLHYFDGTNTREICNINRDNQSWAALQNMFPDLFNPSYAVSAGFSSNYVTLKPEKYLELIYLARKLNPKATFDRHVDNAFVPLYANLAQHAEIRALLIKHEDPRTLEQLTEDIVKDMLGNVALYLGEYATVDPKPAAYAVMEQVAVYLSTGDYGPLADAIAKYDPSWLSAAANFFYKSEVDKTLNIIKDMRQSAFLDKALKSMIERQYGADYDQVHLPEWQQKILGRKYAGPDDERVLQQKLEQRYGRGATLQQIIQTKLEERGIIHVKDMKEPQLSETLAANGVHNLEQAILNKIKEKQSITSLDEIIPANRQTVIDEAKAAIFAEVQQRIDSNITSTEIFPEIADDIVRAGSPGSGNTSKPASISDLSLDEAMSETSESHLLNFDIDPEDVTSMWEEHRVTKDAFKTSLLAMEAKLQELAQAAADDKIELDSIPLPKELVLEGATNEGKTVVEHIQDCITRFKAKVENDKSQTNVNFYQADCATLYNSINQIIRFQFSGDTSDFMVTEEQRGVYNNIAVDLKTILNNTQKQPIKALEIMGSVEPVRAEITRLITFHNELRKQLIAYQAELKTIDQGTFYNDIAAFIKGPFNAKQQQLEALLASLHGIRDEAFNVLDPQNDWQRAVCDAVTQLTAPGQDTEMVNKLQDVLLYVQQKQAKGAAVDDGPMVERQYIPIGVVEDKPVSVVNQRKNAENAPKFASLMRTIQAHAATLEEQEMSQLHEFFGGYDLKLMLESDLGDAELPEGMPVLVQQEDGTYQVWGHQDGGWQLETVEITEDILQDAGINERDFGDKRRLHIDLGSQLFNALKPFHHRVELTKHETATLKTPGRLGAFGGGGGKIRGSFDLDDASQYSAGSKSKR